MSDYRTIRNNVLIDIFRTGTLTAQANVAIQDAIKFYEGTAFWFNETRATAQTVADQPWYAVPADFVELVSLTIDINDDQYPLVNKPFEYIEERYVNNTADIGYPQVYAIYDEQIRLWPTPDASGWQLTFAYIRRLSDLSEEDDTNAWAVEGEPLIRARAEWYLATRILEEYQRADRVKQIEAEELQRLRSETTRRLTTGRVRKRRA